ncbi:MAG: hypothetical protein AAF581_16150, partial [Planctomycetota bacterium]
MTKDLDRWFNEEAGLIAPWAPRGGGRHSIVPEGLQVLPEDESAGLVQAGSESLDPGLILRSGNFMVPVHAPPLRDRAGFTGRFIITLQVTAPESRTAALLLRDRALRGGGDNSRYGIADLAAHLAKHLEKRLRASLESANWDGSGGVMETFRRDDVAASVFREPLFELGMTLRGVSGFSVDSDELDEYRQRESELRRRAEEVRDRLEFLELWKREELGEALAREEVEKLAGHLRKEGLLRELDVEHEVAVERISKQRAEAQERGRLRRMLERERIATEADVDQERLAYEIEKAQRLHTVLEKHGLLAVVGQLGDSPDHARLLELLVEREMTPEQLAARSAADTRWEELEERLEEMASQLHRGNSALEQQAAALPSIEQIWLAAGVSLYRLSGAAAKTRGVPTPVLPVEDLGFLRSVVVLPQSEPLATTDEPDSSSTEAGPAVLVGAQGGVGVYRVQGSHWSIYRYRPAPQGRGGANSAAIAHGLVMASHSELGLHAWPEMAPSTTPEQLCEPPARGVQMARGVQVQGGVVYFARGSEVLSLRGVANDVVSLGTLPDSVTALCHDGGELIAGTRDGQLFRYGGATVWNKFPFRSSGPIFRIAPTGGRGLLRWVVGARQR